MDDIKGLVDYKLDELNKQRENLDEHSSEYRELLVEEGEILKAYRDYLKSRSKLLELITENK